MADELLLVMALSDGAAMASALSHPMAALEPRLVAVCETLGVRAVAVSLEESLTPTPLLRQARMVWLVSDQPEPRGWQDLGYLCEEYQLPALLTRAMESKPAGSRLAGGFVVVPPEISARSMIALFQASWHHGQMMASMREEMGLLRRHQHGLAGQIDHMDEEMRLAAKMQRDLLPDPLPTPPGLAVEALYRPASYVSGDTFDVSLIDDNHLSLFLADATGHGVSAAMMTVYIQRSLRTARDGYAGVRPPGEVLAMLNNDLVKFHCTQVRFCTAVYAVLELSTLRLTVARAGHPFPMLLHADRPREQLEADGALLGVFEDATFEPMTVQMAPRDRLLIYSDGFELAFDALDAPVVAGRRSAASAEQYTRRLAELTTSGLPTLDRLGTNLDAQSGSLHQRDDLTALLLTVLPSAASA